MASKADSGKKYHEKATGQALKTVEAHAKEEDITLFGSCFCPFVQRVWAAFEYLGIPYHVSTPLTSQSLARSISCSTVSDLSPVRVPLELTQVCR